MKDSIKWNSWSGELEIFSPSQVLWLAHLQPQMVESKTTMYELEAYFRVVFCNRVQVGRSANVTVLQSLIPSPPESSDCVLSHNAGTGISFLIREGQSRKEALATFLPWSHGRSLRCLFSLSQPTTLHDASFLLSQHQHRVKRKDIVSSARLWKSLECFTPQNSLNVLLVISAIWGNILCGFLHSASKAPYGTTMGCLYI